MTDDLFRLIPDIYADAVRGRLCADKLCEMRVRNRMPVRVQYDGAYYYLCKNGITKNVSEAFVAEKNEVENIVMRACEFSLYTVTDTLKNGYISVSGGIRIGVCGSGVISGGSVNAVKNFTAVNIRLPHQVTDCAYALYCKVVSGRILNTLIISPPGAGKTTVLRDLCRLVSDRGYNVLLCDEKYEIASAGSGVPSLDVGMCTDVVSGMDKARVFKMGIANMRPDAIFVDELFGDDTDAVKHAAYCGIAVVATAHARDLAEFRSKPDFRKLIDSRTFSRFCVLGDAPHRSVNVFDGEYAAV
ncbi:MAG: Flp pilus assembly complex ATPase component TadA [Roseburia sp.]|nr:Flp pilus assembly complex ATPase component TadA [Roseburia sp.]